MKASAESAAGVIAMKCRTAMIHARVIVSWYFDGSTMVDEASSSGLLG